MMRGEYSIYECHAGLTADDKIKLMNFSALPTHFELLCPTSCVGTVSVSTASMRALSARSVAAYVLNGGVGCGSRRIGNR